MRRRTLRVAAVAMTLAMLMSGCGAQNTAQENQVTEQTEVKDGTAEDNMMVEPETAADVTDSIPLNVIEDNYRTYYEVFVYSFCDSNGDGIGDIPGLISKLDYINDDKETRRHCSLDAFNLDDTLFPSDENVEAETETKDQYRRLYDAIALLEPQQKELVRQVFFNERKIVDIASEEGVSEAAIRNRLKKIIQRLKKILN